MANGILHVLRGSIPWCMIPRDSPLRCAVWWYFRNWPDDGTWDRAEEAFRARVREAAEGRAATPSAVITDSQSVKTTAKRRTRGYDAGHKVAGRKRHTVVEHHGADSGRGVAYCQHPGSGFGSWLLLLMVRRQPDGHRFEAPLLRWVVERSLAWFNRRRRQSKDFETRPDASAPWFHVAMLHLALKMLRPAYVIFYTHSQRRETKGRMATRFC